MRKNRFQGLYWHIETKLPIAFLKLISTLKLSKGKSYASKIRNTFQVTQEYITLVEKIGTCSRYHPNAMSKITANGRSSRESKMGVRNPILLSLELLPMPMSKAHM